MTDKSGKMEKNLKDMFFKSNPNTFTWGIPEMDKKFGRFQQRELVFMVAWTWVGKSNYALFMALQNAKAHKNVVVYSLETAPEVTMRNYIASSLWIEPSVIDDQSYTEEQKHSIISMSNMEGYRKYWPRLHRLTFKRWRHDGRY